MKLLNTIHRLHQLATEGVNLLPRLIGGLRQRHRERQQAVSPEARLNLVEAHDAASQHAGKDQHHHREPELKGDQTAPPPGGAKRARCHPGPGSLELHMRSRCAQRRP